MADTEALSTVPTHFTRLPVRTVTVEVVDGPDRGLSCSGESESLAIGTATSNQLVLTDPTVSRFHAELHAEEDGILVADSGSTNGTRAGSILITRAVVPPGTVLRFGQTSVRVGEGDVAEIDLFASTQLAQLKGRNQHMRRLMAQVQKAAASDVSVLISGESGTGKELVAEAIHQLSSRASGPFVIFDSASVAPTLVASELFGHERGAFTGATGQHVGAFERANGGTLFLDEIGELSPELQPVLLGALERRRFRRVGGRTELTTNVRVVSATNRDLRTEINSSRFRLDLYYRLAMLRLEVPPLRERLDDIPVLVDHFLAEAGRPGESENLFPPDVINALMEHTWPGNIRELKNFVEATLALGSPAMLEPSARPTTPAPSGGPAGSPELYDLPYKEARSTVLREFETRYLRRLLERSGGSVRQAARIARADRSHLIELLRRHNIR